VATTTPRHELVADAIVENLADVAFSGSPSGVSLRARA
jgi:hypothetical protein